MMAKEFSTIWDAIEQDPTKAASLKLRSELMMKISVYVKESKLTQTQAAEKLGVNQPRLNDALKGRIKKCTVDRLVNMLSCVDYKVDLKISRAA